MWDVTIDGLRVSVKTGSEEISAVRGAVTFRSGDPLGERCGNEIPVTADTLGARGYELVSGVRSTVPDARIMISPHNLVVSCARREDVSVALSTISKLGEAKLRPNLVGSRWLSDRMVRYEFSADTPLTTTAQTLRFDSEANHVPYQLYYDFEGRKLRRGDLTAVGEQLLAAIINWAKRFGITLVAVSRTCCDFCLTTPCGEEHQQLLARKLASNLGFAIA